MNWKQPQIRIKLTLLVIIGVIGVFSICLFTYSAFRSLRQTVQDFQYPDQRIDQLNALLNHSNNADIFLRLYSITHKKEYLQQYREASDSVTQAFNTYRLYIKDNAVKSSKIDSIEYWWKIKEAENKELIRLAKAKPDLQIIEQIMDDLKDTLVASKNVYEEKIVRDSLVVVRKIPSETAGNTGLVYKVKKIFGKKSEQEGIADSLTDDPIDVELFSYTYKKHDTLVTDTLVKIQSMSMVNKAKVKNVLQKNIQYNTVFNLKRLAAIEKDFTMRDHINYQIGLIQAQEKADAHKNISAIQKLSQNTISQIFWIFLLVLLTGIFLYILLLLDTYRIKRYEEELLIEKSNYQELAANRARFLSMMAHELRTPLQSVIGFSELLEDPRTASATKSMQYAGIIKKSSAHLLQTVNLLLDRSKIDSGKLELEQASFVLHECISDVFESLRIQADRKQIEYTWHSTLPQDLMVLSDPLRLKQILYNLLSNALKFTNHGSVSLSSVLAEEKDGSVRIHFSVKDTGPGIPASKLKHLFEEYNQLNKSTERIFGGSGLGLFITKKLLALFSSELRIINNVDSGTSFLFSVIFPRALSMQKETSSSLLVSGKRVLVIDDDEHNLLYTHQVLSTYSVSVCLAASIKESIEQIRQHQPDIILCDVYIHEALGTELLPYVEDRTFVIFMSADHVQLEKLKQQQFITLAKPFTPNELITLLNTLPVHMFSEFTPAEGAWSSQDASVHTDSLRAKSALLDTAIKEHRIQQVLNILHQLKTTFGYLNKWEEVTFIQKTETEQALHQHTNLTLKAVKNRMEIWKTFYSS